MNATTTTHVFTTKAGVPETEHRTTLTIDWSGLTQDDILEYASRAVIIRWQAAARSRAAAKRDPVLPPSRETVRPNQPRTRASVPATDRVARALAGLTPEQLAAALAMARSLGVSIADTAADLPKQAG